jgi:tetratricopeptide (TPR) repeat protein
MRFTCARTQLRVGLGGLASREDRGQAIQRVEQARDLYAALSKESSDTPVLHQEALLGVAQAQESLGQVQEAVEAYQSLVNLYPDSKYPDCAAVKVAKARVEYLQDPKNQVPEFYAAMDKLGIPSLKPR